MVYMGRTRKFFHAGNGREKHLPGVPNIKVDGYCQETKEVFQYLGCFWHECLCMSNRHKPIGNTEGTLENRYEETMARLRKIKTLVTLLFRSGV
jgi:G:T-mismatch repair DNA endonuclease (very short patch repair protein)